jgi:hypothetical protein
MLASILSRVKASLGALGHSTFTHWREAIYSHLYTAVGGLAPLWIGWIALTFFRRSPTIADFARNGEFALYSAAVLAPALYIVSTQVPPTPIGGRAPLVLFCIAFTLCAVVGYVIVMPVASGLVGRVEVDELFLVKGTLSLFGLSMLLSFLITVLHNIRSDPEVRAMVEAQQAELEENFDELT